MRAHKLIYSSRLGPFDERNTGRIPRSIDRNQQKPSKNSIHTTRGVRCMSWKWDILNQYALHLFEAHHNDPNFDTSLEHRIMNDFLMYEKWRDGQIIHVNCDHIKCNWSKKYVVSFTVHPLEEEE